MPAPGPEKTVVPISSPSIAIIFVLPLTCAIGLSFLINLGETSCLSLFFEYSAVASNFILYPIKISFLNVFYRNMVYAFSFHCFKVLEQFQTPNKRVKLVCELSLFLRCQALDHFQHSQVFLPQKIHLSILAHQTPFW